MSAMITSIFPLTSAGIRAPKSWSSSRSSLPMYAANRLASSTSKPASCPSWTALKGKPPLEMPTTSVPLAGEDGISGMRVMRLVIQRSTMSACVPFSRMLLRKALNDARRSVLDFANPAATSDAKIGLPKGTRSSFARRTSFRVSRSLRPASTFPALTASVTS